MPEFKIAAAQVASVRGAAVAEPNCVEERSLMDLNSLSRESVQSSGELSPGRV
jgi:hypothetical protein